MITVPADTPFTVPLALPTVANAVLLLDHTPPAGVAVSDVPEPAHTERVPVIAPGTGLTVMVVVAKQPEPVV
jgi:hypothetical protein